MSELRINHFLQMLFSLDDYALHANSLNINSGMKDMLINLYGTLLDFAKNETNPNPYGTIKEIIKQYNAIAIIEPLNNNINLLNSNIANLQTQLDAINEERDDKDIEIAELKIQLTDKNNKIEKLTEEIKNLHQRY